MLLHILYICGAFLQHATVGDVEDEKNWKNTWHILDTETGFSLLCESAHVSHGISGRAMTLGSQIVLCPELS
jgi:hypothetical protein